MTSRLSVLGVLFLFVLTGCTSLSPRPAPILSDSVEGCRAFLSQLDDQVKEAGVREASDHPVPGFPYFRTNRFLSALRDRIKDEKEREEWLKWMRTLDQRAREKEIDNLPEDRVLSLRVIETALPNRREVSARVQLCSERLLTHDKASEGFDGLLPARVDVPDEYSFLRRAIGLYPLMVIPVAIVNRHAEVKTESWFKKNLDQLPVLGRLETYAPAENLALREEEVRDILANSRKNALGIPLPDDDQGRKLAWSLAPAVVQDVSAPYDRIGQAVWRGNRVGIDPEKPTVYYYFSHAFLKGEPILQINYVAWYSERTGETPPSIEKGRLDGWTYRVSLDLRGGVFMVDVMNNCGCYHLFAPLRERIERIVSNPLRPDPFVPQWLPELSARDRLAMRLSSGWHRVERLLPVSESENPVPYDLVPYDHLMALPAGVNRTENIFDSRGIAKGSERTERFILFSMGIREIGSMREKGHHAIALIGRTHFDDPYLFDQSFVFRETQ